MGYFEILGLKKEPFSTSPDPDFFYLSKDHERALTNSLIELRLKRGLSIILGDVGTGKTTLSRKLVQELKKREDFCFHVIFDPSFENEYSFLEYLVRNFNCPINTNDSPSLLELKESLEAFLFQKGVSENKIIALVVDEAQKLSPMSLEVLRVLLNYETNEFKLLQLVLLGQMELYSTIMNIPNFFDRISFKFTLNPLDYGETKEMIEFRLRQAGYKDKRHLFLEDGIKKIYEYTNGYPRKIMMLCYKALKKIIVDNKLAVDGKMIEEIIKEEEKAGWHKTSLPLKRDY
ncbi:MAG: AAA family ATPase [Candidatus Ratteibacteria bacterium]|nr:AAA family ATPase [Candidatus Ratteibacteria bacterium]